MALRVKPIFSDLVNRAEAGGFRPNDKELRDWFREKASEVASVPVSGVINANRLNQRNAILPGKMYLFQYDAKTKEKLPYWDKYPLIFPIERYDDGFLGINLHYLPLMYRARLMDALYELTVNDKYDGTTKLRISYNLLNSASKYKYFEPCVKRYLNSHVRSRFLLIHPTEWDVALFLPLERFQKKNKSTVWNESMKIIRGTR